MAVYRFDEIELDTAKHELRRRGSISWLQPRAFAVLEYLLRHRDRAVPREELLQQLWPDAVVGDGSLRRAVTLARAAIHDDSTRIRTVPRVGYRFVAEVEEADGDAAALLAAPDFVPQFARSGDVHVAYHTVGEGEIDIVVVAGLTFPMRALLDHTAPRGFIRDLTRFGRVILFDKRGTGMSDRVKHLPELQQRMDDLRAVLDAAESRQAVLLGYSEGGPLSILFATAYPERTRGLALIGSFARWIADTDYDFGWKEDKIRRLKNYIESAWGRGATVRSVAQSHASDPDVIAWAARAEQHGASPGAALDLLEMNLKVDVRELLPLVSVPTMIVHQEDDAVFDVANGRYLAERVPGAHLEVVRGRDHTFLFEDRVYLLNALERLLEREDPPLGDRFLTTVLTAQVEGDDDGLLADRAAVAFKGIAAGPRTYRFDGPTRAIGCAHALIAAYEVQHKNARVGVHTGEVTRAGLRLGGDGVDVSSAIARSAEWGEVWVSRIVRDLIHGSRSGIAKVRSIELEGARPIEVVRSEPVGENGPSRERSQNGAMRGVVISTES